MSATSVAVEPTAEQSPPVRDAVRLKRVAVVLAVVAVANALAMPLFSAVGDPRFRFGLDPASIGFLASITLFPVVGALIVQRRPFTRVAWLMIAIGLGLGLELLSFGYSVIGSAPNDPLPGAEAALLASQLFLVPVAGSLFSILVLLFPTDRLSSPRWTAVAVVAVAGAVMYELGVTFRPGLIDETAFPSLSNPLGAPPALAGIFDALEVAGNTLVIGSFVLATLSLVVRYRRADPVEAAQIRWIALFAGLAGIALTVAALQLGTVSDIGFGVGLVLLGCVPVAIGIAISRYRLYDIDRLINRTLVYGSLTAILAGIFTAGIGLAQRVFIATTGESSDVPIVLTTLVVATLYAPLRKRLEAIVDRYFKYDERRFGAYRDQLAQLLALLDPTLAAQRLAEEAVHELEATGSAVVDADEHPTATAGAWPVPVVVRMRIPGGSGPLRAILVGPRRDGRPHDPQAVAQLEEIATLVVTAARVPATATSASGTRA